MPTVRESCPERTSNQGKQSWNRGWTSHGQKATPNVSNNVVPQAFVEVRSTSGRLPPILRQPGNPREPQEQAEREVFLVPRTRQMTQTNSHHRSTRPIKRISHSPGASTGLSIRSGTNPRTLQCGVYQGSWTLPVERRRPRTLHRVTVEGSVPSSGMRRCSWSCRTTGRSWRWPVSCRLIGARWAIGC